MDLKILAANSEPSFYFEKLDLIKDEEQLFQAVLIEFMKEYVELTSSGSGGGETFAQPTLQQASAVAESALSRVESNLKRDQANNGVIRDTERLYSLELEDLIPTTTGGGYNVKIKIYSEAGRSNSSTVSI